MSTQPQPKTQALVGLVVGAIALVLITAILTSAVSSSSADKRTEALAAKLEKVTRDLTALRDATDQRQQGTLKARAGLQHDNDVLQRQNQILQRRLLVLIRLAHDGGVEVPKDLTTPTSPPTPKASATRPKAPRPTSRAAPTPTAPSPSTPIASTPSADRCWLLPVLCPSLQHPTTSRSQL